MEIEANRIEGAVCNDHSHHVCAYFPGVFADEVCCCQAADEC